ncbi:MAG: hypothetical protein J7M09_01070, partial [Deltaproteobacteria bacterium]|nr:hypothetical protein [Candidatus Tharpella sp.]
FICLGFLVFWGLTSCGRPPLDSGSLLGASVDGRAAWTRMVKLESLKAAAILSWRVTDGQHGKYKVRLFVEPPERLKIQWLTPWGSVAGQLLMGDDQFWFSDSRQRVTWHGQAVDFMSLFEQQENFDWAVATQFFRYWPLLFSSPDDDDRRFGKQTFIDYLIADEGRSLSKIIRFASGEEMHIRLNDLEAVADGRFLARNIEVLGRNGLISLNLRKYTMLKELAPENFIYNLKNFKIRECIAQEGDSYVGK